ncbi:hypothetical protein [Zhihengliuella flava]|uniref:Uncharacterized protein n=1 Tax=Zhihengliuella flava TaxID=1285193 RepID=A0A931GDK1_9MICC|nr:hypothetical protein [Zhihengliuella flava]MBG6083538.1 hypothetical protein [Zhihengliuella flava]
MDACDVRNSEVRLEELRIPAMGARRDLALVATNELIRHFPALERLLYSPKIGARYVYVGHGGQVLLGESHGNRAAAGVAELRIRLVALANDAEFPPALTLIAQRDHPVLPGFREAITCWPEQEDARGRA